MAAPEPRQYAETDRRSVVAQVRFPKLLGRLLGLQGVAELTVALVAPDDPQAVVTEGQTHHKRCATRVLHDSIISRLSKSDRFRTQRTCADGSLVHDFKGQSVCPACGLRPVLLIDGEPS